MKYFRLETDDAHQMFRMGQMYWEGTRILRDEVKGTALIRQAAERGYKHAMAWIKRNGCDNN